jgi:hypothetical protein
MEGEQDRKCIVRRRDLGWARRPRRGEERVAGAAVAEDEETTEGEGVCGRRRAG